MERIPTKQGFGYFLQDGMLLCLLTTAFFLILPEPADAEVAVPALSGPVIDLGGLLDNGQTQSISQALQRYRQEHGIQFQVLIMPTLDGEPIEQFSIRAADAWKIGDGKDRGAILLISLADKKLRIEVGRGLEGDLPDALCGRILREVLTPAFQAGDYAGGLMATLSAMAERAGGKLSFQTNNRHGRRTQKWSSSPIWNGLILLFFFIAMLLSRVRRRSGMHLPGGIWMGGGAPLGGGFSGRSGGGWSGGGGGFSGGGASGGW